jgi:SPP1 family phage portal protein
MNIEEILAISDTKKKLDLLCQTKDEVAREPDVWQDEYDSIHNIDNRLNKSVGSASTETADGQMTQDTRKTIITAKISIPVQKNIVRSAVAFSVGGGVNMTLVNNDDEELRKVFNLFRKAIDNTKIDAFNMKLTNRLCVESEVAELWYVPAEEINGVMVKPLKHYLMSRENGDEIYPHFDEYGDMDAFTRKYQVKDEKNALIPHYTIYTAKEIISIVGRDLVQTSKPNLYGKIPVIYYDQKIPEWKDVQIMIDRLEMILSKLADMNDYFASPIIKFKGKVTTPPNKDDIGKSVQIEGEEIDGKMSYGDVDYLVWKNSPETTKSEIELLLRFINSLTSTPDISFDNVKDLNGSISGVALQTMFLDAILKGQEKQELILREGFTRRINLIKAIMLTIEATTYKQIADTEIKLNFKSVIPQDLAGMIDILSTALGGSKVMSLQTALQWNPLVTDPQAEIELMEEEDAEEAGTLNL